MIFFQWAFNFKLHSKACKKERSVESSEMLRYHETLPVEYTVPVPLSGHSNGAERFLPSKNHPSATVMLSMVSQFSNQRRQKLTETN